MDIFPALKLGGAAVAASGITAFGINYIDKRVNNLNIDVKTLAVYRACRYPQVPIKYFNIVFIKLAPCHDVYLAV
jgi:hypothetical protein